MQIRQATRKDAFLLSRLNVDVQRLHAEAVPGQFKLPESDDFAESFFSMALDDPATIIFIAEEDEAVGYILTRIVHRDENPFNYAQDYLEIEHISVPLRFQGKGCGTALIERAFTLAKEKGLSKVTLSTWYFNTSAQDFFNRMGFTPYMFRMWALVEKP